MKSIQRLVAVIVTVAISAVLFGVPANAAPGDKPPLDAAAAAAFAAAAEGDTTQLEALINGPDSAEVQDQLRAWLESRGQLADLPTAPDPLTVPEPAPLSEPGTTDSAPATPEPGVAGPSLDAAAASATCGGYYECFCQSYSGVTMGWYNKIVLACHGYLDTYISGRHVSHTIPDLFPRSSGTISLGCALAIAGTITAVMSIPITAGASAYGWAVWGSGTFFSGADLVLSC